MRRAGEERCVTVRVCARGCDGAGGSPGLRSGACPGCHPWLREVLFPFHRQPSRPPPLLPALGAGCPSPSRLSSLLLIPRPRGRQAGEAATGDTFRLGSP